MKEGINLVDLARTIQDQAARKYDVRAHSNAIAMTPDESKNDEGADVITNHFTIGNDLRAESFAIGNTMHAQLAARLNIPKKYYDRMREEAPQLLASNVNNWIDHDPQQFLVRTLRPSGGDVTGYAGGAGTARAFLSSRYRTLDNDELAEAVLPVISELGCQVKSCQVTDKRLYIQAVNPSIEDAVTVGDPVQAGVVISNSEIGLGSVLVEPLIYRLVCTNGMISIDNRFRKNHSGRAQAGDIDINILQRETIKQSNKALWMQVRDLTRAALDATIFEAELRKMRDITDRTIESDVATKDIVEVVTNDLRLTNGESNSVLDHLIKGGDLTQYGVLNAVTRTAEDVEDYDRAIELERMGGQILNLSERDWGKVNKRAAALAA